MVELDDEEQSQTSNCERQAMTAVVEDARSSEAVDSTLTIFSDVDLRDAPKSKNKVFR